MNTFINRQNSRISPYEKKIAELQGMVEKEAKKVQDAIEEKEAILKDIEALKREKTRLEGKISELKGNKKEEEEALNTTIDRKTKFVDNTKQELAKEKKNLAEIKKLIKKTEPALKDLQNTSKELREFITKEADTREKWLSVRQKINESDAEYGKRMTILQKKEEKSAKDKQKLTSKKKYLTEIYGKITTYTSVMKQTLEYVNNFMKENNVPIHFNLPPGEVMEIDFDNFHKHEHE